jgi:hypothetical protein
MDLHARLRADFRVFLTLLWRHLGLPDPTKRQLAFARYLQHGPKRRMVQAFRGAGKSWVTAAYVLWRLFCDPRERVLVVSANEDRALQFVAFCRRLIEEVEVLHFLRPAGHQLDAALAFEVGPAPAHQSPSLRAASITGQITGGRASLIVADDVEIPRNSLTQTMRDKLAEAIKEFDAVIMPDADMKLLGLARADVVYLGTPQTESSIYSRLPERGYDVRIWPARYPSDTRRYGGKLAPDVAKELAANPALAGRPTEPLRFSEEDLIERELSYGRAGFALQFMLDTSLSDVEKYPLKIRDLIVMALNGDLAPARVAWGTTEPADLPCVGLQGDRWHKPIFWTKDDFTAYQGVVMAIDPSGRGGDELAYAVVAQLHGFLYVLDCKGLKGGATPQNLQSLADLAKLWNVKSIIIEENFGDGMFTSLLTPYLVATYPCSTEEVKHSVQKERRICDVLEPLILQHRVIVNEALVKADLENYNGYPAEHFHRFQLFYQLSHITREKGSLAKYDRVDVLSMACAYFVTSVQRDVSRIEEERKAKARDDELRRFAERHGLSRGRKNYHSSITGRVSNTRAQRGPWWRA